MAFILNMVVLYSSGARLVLSILTSEHETHVLLSALWSIDVLTAGRKKEREKRFDKRSGVKKSLRLFHCTIYK